MTEKQLRNLSRTDLLQLLVDLSAENSRLQEALDDANAKLASRKIELENSESLADAALRLSGVYKAADEAVKLYLENIVVAEKAKLKKEAEGK